MLTIKNVVRHWDEFFFAQRPVEGIAFFRIFWMALIFCYFLFDLSNIDDFYGPHSILSLTTVKDRFSFIHANLFHLFTPGPRVTYAIIFVYGISLICSILGFQTRIALTLSLICMTSLHQRNIWLLSSSELLMRAITLLLIFSPCGEALSLDSLFKRSSGKFLGRRLKPVWVLRLIQVQVSVIYLWTFWHKLKGETWFDGSAVYYATRLEAMTNFTFPYLMDSLFILKMATWGTLVLEFSLGALIWVKEFRRPLILIGIFFHLGIEYFMSIPFFEWFMIALLFNFFTPEEFRFLFLRIERSARRLFGRYSRSICLFQK